MNALQRHHYNMKDGFAQDRERQSEVGNLYEGLDAQDFERLAGGFGRKIGELFQDRYPGHKAPADQLHFVLEHDLRTDGGWGELRPAIRELVARLGDAA